MVRQCRAVRDGVLDDDDDDWLKGVLVVVVLVMPRNNDGMHGRCATQQQREFVGALR